MAESFLSQDEVDTLLSGLFEGDAESAPSYEACDLSSGEHVARGGMPKLETINDTFLRLLRGKMSKLLRRDVSASCAEVRRTSYGNFIESLSAPSHFTVVRFKPLRGLALVALDPLLVFLIVDRMFGGLGRPQSHATGRDFTHTEHRIIKRVLDVVLACYAKSWEAVLSIVPEHVRTEVNAHLVNLVLPNTEVLDTATSIVVGSCAGELHICMPYPMLEPVQDALCNGCHDPRGNSDGKWAPLLAEGVEDAEVELIAHLGDAAVTLRDVLSMKPGDVIPLTIPKVVAATVDSRAVMDCTYGVFNGRYALRVEKMQGRHPR
jgi:flagellar motor switch protein FliM